MAEIERVKTGIPGFDELVQGGIPKLSTTVVTGSPGTGKTILALQYIYNGATKFNEKGLYVTFEQGKEELYRQALQFGWDFRDLEKKKSLEIMDIPVSKLTHKTINDIRDKVKKEKFQRIVIDSLTTLAINAPILTNVSKISLKSIMDENTVFSPPIIGDFILKQFIYSFISQLKTMGVTSILISDTAQSGEYMTIDTVSEYAADGVILINFETLGGAYSRTMIVRKMRHTHNDEDIHPLEISAQGIIVHNIQNASGMGMK